MKTKQCTKCSLTKPIGEFHRNGNRGWHCYCKQCYNATYRGTKRKRNPEAKRRHNLKARYGLTESDVAKMLESQAGVCAICKTPPIRPCIDHCHKTGRVRGILCHKCNVFVAALEDADFAKRAKEYLQR